MFIKFFLKKSDAKKKTKTKIKNKNKDQWMKEIKVKKIDKKRNFIILTKNNNESQVLLKNAKRNFRLNNLVAQRAFEKKKRILINSSPGKYS